MFALVLVSSLPTAAAHVDFCTGGACVYEWSWSWGGGSCTQGRDVWWSHRIVRASAELEGVRHGVKAETWCDAYDLGDSEGGASSVHVEYTTTDLATGERSWIWIDWYGAESTSGSYCIVRVWSEGQDLLPTGTIQRDCPARPPFVQGA